MLLFSLDPDSSLAPALAAELAAVISPHEDRWAAWTRLSAAASQNGVM